MFYFDVLADGLQLHILYYGLGEGVRSELVHLRKALRVRSERQDQKGQ